MTKPLPPNPLKVNRKLMPNSKYEPELALEVCVRIAGGETLTKIMDSPRMPTTQTFHVWRARYPELAKLYSEARVVQGHGYFDEVADLGKRLTNPLVDQDSIDSRKAQVAISAFQWLAARLVPQEYGDKASKTPAVAIQIITSLGIDDGKVKEEEGKYVIELMATKEVVEVEKED